MRIAIVNDLVIAVEALRRVVATIPGAEVAWVAMDGAEAVERCRRDRPELILMDLIMPVMDGVTATGIIMRESPCPILVVTATVAGNAAKVFEAMGHGALDAVCTPVFAGGGRIEGGEELLKKIAVIGKLIGREIPVKTETGTAASAGAALPCLVAIGSSAGGPKALAAVLARMPAGLDACIVIVQHVDAQFAQGLAEWLDEQTPMKVSLAREAMRPEAGRVCIAGTNDHLVLGGDLSFHYTPEPIDYPYRPSADTFFSSARRNWPRQDIAALLTGMGRDGAKGLLDLRGAGWHTIAQDEQSSVVYGMPKAAAEIGAAAEILPLEKIAQAVVRKIRQKEKEHVS